MSLPSYMEKKNWQEICVMSEQDIMLVISTDLTAQYINSY